METLSFAFGMLAMVAVLLIATIVVGIVRVYYHQKRINNLERTIGECDWNLHQRIDRTDESLRSYIDSRIDKLQNNIKEKGSKELLRG